MRLTQLIPRQLRHRYYQWKRKRNVPHLNVAPCVRNYPADGWITWNSTVNDTSLIHVELDGPVLYERPIIGGNCVGVELIDHKGHVHARQFKRTPA